MRTDELYTIDESKLYRTVLLLLDLFVKGDFDGLALIDKGGRLSATMMRDMIHNWPSTLIMPPLDKLNELINVLEVNDTIPQKWSVYVNFWSEAEDRSDLTLRLTLTDSPGDYYTVEIDDIEVL